MKKGPRSIPKIRRSWIINPKTRVKRSARIDSRAGLKKELTDILKRKEDEQGA